tara:strand:- start:3713 stop:5641 length:1929 start_codon:yes stop_codon:yes gene_type:complete
MISASITYRVFGPIILFLCFLSQETNAQVSPFIDIANAYNGLNIEFLGVAHTGIYDQGAAEITAYDEATGVVLVTNAAKNTLMKLDISNPVQPEWVDEVSLDSYGGGLNSIDIHNGIVAVALEAETQTDSGTVVFFNTENLSFSHQVKVGPLPDMLVFTNSGTLLTANEGQPNSSYSIDPEGSVSVIFRATDHEQHTVQHADFTSFSRTQLLQKGVRLSSMDENVGKDLEPEYITVDETRGVAYVSLQENNALGIIDIDNARVTDIVGLGEKDHSLEGHGIDGSDRDDQVQIKPWPVFGLYMPDAIAGFEHADEFFIVSANEGDSREYGSYSDEVRVKDLSLDPTSFDASIQSDDQLGRLQVITPFRDEDVNANGDVKKLYAFGTRSMSIWDHQGRLIFDTGDLVEKKTADFFPEDFNSDNAENDSKDSRSDAKGPEPEAVTIGTLGGKTIAFLGLERIGGVMLFDVTIPDSTQYMGYVNARNFSAPFSEDDSEILDLEAVIESGPESITLVPSLDNTNATIMVLGNESTGSVTLYKISYSHATTSTAGTYSSLPKGFELKQNIPNPFNPVTQIEFEVFTPDVLELHVYNILGQRLTTLYQGPTTRGEYQVEFDGTSLSSGVYYVELKSQHHLAYISMLLTK